MVILMRNIRMIMVNVTLISKLDISNPLHLHPNDSATLTVVSIKLKGTENYQVWSYAMLLALEGKNKTGFIDGSCRRSNTDEVLGRQWDRVNAIVLADYYHKLNALWKQFDALVQLPRCTCHAAEDFKKHNSLMKLMQFLMGLDDSYMAIRSNICLEIHYLMLEEDQGGPPKLVCENCGFNGHTIDSSLSTFSDDQLSKIISLIKDNSLNNGKGVQANMAAGVIVNSGANQHLTYTNKYLVNVINISKLGITVSHPNGTEACITKVANMLLNENLTLYDVLVVPEYSVSLMSVHKVARDSGLIVDFNENKYFVLPQDLREMKILGTGNQIDGLYYFNDETQGINFGFEKPKCNLSKYIWHNRLGHPSNQVLKVLKHDLAFDNSDIDHCEICQKSKQTREPFPLNDYTRSVWVYMLKVKDEVFDCVLTFYNLIKNQFGKTVKTFQSDNGTEFVNNVFDKFCIDNGIVNQITCAYTPQQNGIVERKHRHLLNVARLPSSVLNGKTPFELVFNKKLVLKHLRVFGCLCYDTILNLHDKLGSRAEKYVLVGYASFKKGFGSCEFEIVHENLDTSNDDTSNPAGSQSDGSHPSNPSNSTIDPFESDLGHSQF
ncbi:ribonuclease H-like domain-containing protein [Tanacetum coccineum]